MRRREFITIAGGVTVAWPFATIAQQGERMRRVGTLMPLRENDPEGKKSVAAFVQGLRELGWFEGGNIRIDYRWAGPDADRITSAAAQLIESKPDAIIAMTPLTLAPLRQMTSTIPIVFVQVSDPVSSGFVASLDRPGGNITGFTSSEFAMSGKILQVFKEAAPAVNRVVVIYNPAQIPQVGRLAAIQTVAPSLGVQVRAASAADADQITHIIENLGNESGDGIIVLPNPITIANRTLIITLTARHHLPAVYELPVFARDGGLMSYGADPAALWHEAASYVDRILKGANPADLPVQQPTKFELIINLRTAKALGLTMPASLLASADEVIE